MNKTTCKILFILIFSFIIYIACSQDVYGAMTKAGGIEFDMDSWCEKAEEELDGTNNLALRIIVKTKEEEVPKDKNVNANSFNNELDFTEKITINEYDEMVVFFYLEYGNLNNNVQEHHLFLDNKNKELFETCELRERKVDTGGNDSFYGYWYINGIKKNGNVGIMIKYKHEAGGFQTEFEFDVNIKIKSELYGDSIQNIEKATEWYKKYFSKDATEEFYRNYEWRNVLNNSGNIANNGDSSTEIGPIGIFKYVRDKNGNNLFAKEEDISDVTIKDDNGKPLFEAHEWLNKKLNLNFFDITEIRYLYLYSLIRYMGGMPEGTKYEDGGEYANYNYGVFVTHFDELKKWREDFKGKLNDEDYNIMSPIINAVIVTIDEIEKIYNQCEDTETFRDELWKFWGGTIENQNGVEEGDGSKVDDIINNAEEDVGGLTESIFEDLEYITESQTDTGSNRVTEDFIDVLNDISYYTPTIGTNNDKFDNKISIVLTVITNVGMIASILMLAIIGVKYMLGSVEEKADYKSEMVPYLVGAALLFGISSIIKILQSIGDIINNL